MGVTYNKLWKLLIDRDMRIADLRKAANIPPNSMTKMRRNEYMSMATYERICQVLDCDFGDIMEYVKDEKK